MNAGIAATGPEPAWTRCWCSTPTAGCGPARSPCSRRRCAKSGRGIVVPRLVNPDGSLQPSLRRTPTVGRALAEALLARRPRRPARIARRADHRPRGLRPARRDGLGDRRGDAASRCRRCARSARGTSPSCSTARRPSTALRAADNGWRTWYEPAAVFEHIGGDSGTNPTLAALMTVNKVALFRRRHNRLHSAAYFAAVAVGECIRAARRPPHVARLDRRAAAAVAAGPGAGGLIGGPDRCIAPATAGAGSCRSTRSPARRSDAWHALRAGNPALDSPYFHPGFAAAVHASGRPVSRGCRARRRGGGFRAPARPPRGRAAATRSAGPARTSRDRCSRRARHCPPMDLLVDGVREFEFDHLLPPGPGFRPVGRVSSRPSPSSTRRAAWRAIWAGPRDRQGQHGPGTPTRREGRARRSVRSGSPPTWSTTRRSPG